MALPSSSGCRGDFLAQAFRLDSHYTSILGAPGENGKGKIGQDSFFLLRFGEESRNASLSACRAGDGNRLGGCLVALPASTGLRGGGPDRWTLGPRPPSHLEQQPPVPLGIQDEICVRGTEASLLVVSEALMPQNRPRRHAPSGFFSTSYRGTFSPVSRSTHQTLATPGPLTRQGHSRPHSLACVHCRKCRRNVPVRSFLHGRLVML